MVWCSIDHVDADLSRLPTGTSGWLSLVNYALALGDLSEVDYLELKGRLAFTQGEGKRSALVLSRAILGMANRMPDLAERHLGGFGIVFVGISQQQEVVSAEEVDAATLSDLVKAYVGEDGPCWDHQFIRHPDGLVLAVIVDPPQWGDSIHACRKNYSSNIGNLSIRDGEVLVRVSGQTRPATSRDLSQLEMRRSKAPHTGAQVRVEYVGAYDRTSRANVREIIEGMVASAAESLLAGLSNSRIRSARQSDILSVMGSALGSADRRSPETFHADVEEWQEKCKAAVEGTVTEFLRHELDYGTLVIENESDRYLEGVRAQVIFPPSVTVLRASDADYCDHGDQFQVFQALPGRPPRYGDLNPYTLGDILMPKIKPVGKFSRALSPTVERTPDGHVVSWSLGDLPPRGRLIADEQFVVFTDENLHVHHHDAEEGNHTPMTSQVNVSWQVTARAIDHVFHGEFVLACRQEPGDVKMWSRRTHREPGR